MNLNKDISLFYITFAIIETWSMLLSYIDVDYGNSGLTDDKPDQGYKQEFGYSNRFKKGLRLGVFTKFEFDMCRSLTSYS